MPVIVNRPGPWAHRDLTAGGTQFHAALAGHEELPSAANTDAQDAGPAKPLILLVHGFPECWWAWRHVIGPLAEAGHRVAAADSAGLRRFGPAAIGLRPGDPGLRHGRRRASPGTRAGHCHRSGPGRAGRVGAGEPGADDDRGDRARRCAAPAGAEVLARPSRLRSGRSVPVAEDPDAAGRSLRTTSGIDRLLRSWAGPRTKQTVTESAGYYAALLARPGRGALGAGDGASRSAQSRGDRLPQHSCGGPGHERAGRAGSGSAGTGLCA